MTFTRARADAWAMQCREVIRARHGPEVAAAMAPMIAGRADVIRARHCPPREDVAPPRDDDTAPPPEHTTVRPAYIQDALRAKKSAAVRAYIARTFPPAQPGEGTPSGPTNAPHGGREDES